MYAEEFYFTTKPLETVLLYVQMENAPHTRQRPTFTESAAPYLALKAALADSLGIQESSIARLHCTFGDAENEWPAIIDEDAAVLLLRHNDIISVLTEL